MWTSTVDLAPQRVFPVRLLGRIWRGAYFTSFAPLQVQNLPRQPLPATTWVRVRNRLSGIDGNDLRLIRGQSGLRTAAAAIPGYSHRYLGHEVVGEIIEIGDDVKNLEVGDRVVLQYGPNCLSSGAQPFCRACANGNYQLCERGDLPGPQPIGGGWSEEMLLPAQQLFKVTSQLSDEQIVMLEPTAIALHAVERCRPELTDRVLIIGAGTMGLLTLHIVHTLVPQAEISIMARHPFQIEQAMRLGASHIIYPQDSYNEVRRTTSAQLYHGLLNNVMLLGGYDIIYDTIGSHKTLYDALRWTRANGTVILVGQDTRQLRLDLSPIWYQEINLLGTRGQGMETWPPGTHRRRPTLDIVLELMEERLLHPEDLITHRFALTDYQSAILTASDKARARSIKVIFDFSLQPATVVPNIRASRPKRTATVRPDNTMSTIKHPRPLEPTYPIESADAPSPPTPAIDALDTTTRPANTPEIDATDGPTNTSFPLEE